jgi:NinB protein
MSDCSLTIELHNRAQAWVVIKDQVYPFLKRWLQDGKRLVLTIKLRKRTPLQNRRYWGKGVLAQITEQAAVGGKLFDAESWHELFKRKFIGVIELPNGEVIGKSSTGLSTAEFSEFCTQVEAFAATELGVTFYCLEPQ